MTIQHVQLGVELVIIIGVFIIAIVLSEVVWLWVLKRRYKGVTRKWKHLSKK